MVDRGFSPVGLRLAPGAYAQCSDPCSPVTRSAIFGFAFGPSGGAVFVVYSSNKVNQYISIIPNVPKAYEIIPLLLHRFW
jgi:hypothetical protein